MRSKNLWIFLAAIILTFLASETALFAATIKTSDYWVMQDGYDEVFVASGGSGHVSVTYGSYPRIDGDVFEVDYPGPLVQFLNYDGAGNLVYHGATFDDTEYGTEWTYLPKSPQIFFPASLETGKTYTAKWDRIEYEDGTYKGTGSDSFTIIVTEEKGVSVPAGTFDTYRIYVIDRYETSTGSSGTSYRTYWLAKGIGWVKMKIERVEYELYNTPSLPPMPPVLKVTKSGYTVTISWDAVEGATGYIFAYAPYPDIGWIEQLDVGLNRYLSGEMPHGSAYYIGIIAYNSVGWSDYSNVEYFVLDGTTPVQVNPTSLTLETGETGTCAISGGSGSYGAHSSDTSVAQVSVNGSALYVLGIASGSATITVYDSASNVTLPVTVTGGSTPSTYTNSLGQTFILLPAGTFTLGSPSNELGRDSDETQHQVTLSQSFYMQQTEVTQAQWEAVMGSNPSYSGCPTCPVEYVSWNDVQSYITQMNTRGEGTYSLPTEAQWEYSARAGSTTAFYNGGITMTGCEYDPNLNAIGWYCYNSDSETHPVAQKTPNAWGLYDMSGNVYEWCQDWYGSYGSAAVTDPTGPSSGSFRVLRGGSWGSLARSCRSASRGDDFSFLGTRLHYIGFRLLRHP